MTEHRPSAGRALEGRAQSEVLGFALVFAVVVSAILVATVFGTTAIQSAQTFTMTESGELAMQSVAADVEAVALGSAHSRVSELDLQSGSLQSGARTTIRVEWIDDPTPGDPPPPPSDPAWKPAPDLPSGKWQFHPIVYSTDAADITYGGSLLVRDQRRGDVALSGPLFSATGDAGDGNPWSERTVLPLVLPRPVSPQSVDGGTRRIVLRRTGTEGRTVAASPLDVRITVTAVRDRLPVWREAVSGIEGVSASDCTSIPAGPSPTATFSCQFETERLVVSRSAVSYRFE